ncbi:MAG TPA: hypothetical protein VGO49_06350 [Bradyrhizobium sp.]|nr:hypothetical protein [Bradyrhizobium sp.]
MGKAAGRERDRRRAHQSSVKAFDSKNGGHGAKSAFAHPTDLTKRSASERSPDGAQRNPGFSHATQQPRISLRCIRATALRRRRIRDRVPVAFADQHGGLRKRSDLAGVIAWKWLMPTYLI